MSELNKDFRFPSIQKIEERMDREMKTSDLPSIVATAVNSSGQEITYTYGPAVWAEKERVTPNHIFRIASMTKMVTSMAVMQLVEQGKIGLDEDLSSILPEMTGIPIYQDGKYFKGKKPITLLHLLTHTSGFGYTLTDEEVSKFDVESWEYKDTPRRFECGERFLYGTSIIWAGRLIAKISGIDLQSYIRANICEPLEMNHTWFEVPDELKHLFVSYGNRGEDGKQPLIESPDRIPTAKVEEYFGDGGLFSSPADYNKLLLCILKDGFAPNGKKIIKKETLEIMYQNHIGEINMASRDFFFKPDFCCDFKGMITSSSKWGLAWMIDTENQDYGRKAGSVMWGGLWNTYFYIDPKSEVAVSIYSQHIPFNHPETIRLFSAFSEVIYSVNSSSRTPKIS